MGESKCQKMPVKDVLTLVAMEISMQWKSTPRYQSELLGAWGSIRHSACPGGSSPRGTACTHLGFCGMPEGFECIRVVRQNSQGRQDSKREYQLSDF